ncbi:MAG: MaoC/PaaZ C-terminal domain-containing protein [Actinomycetota bacterium]|nr:MaoC/PaaZ C-terminal domain-containing protein [Actinomycetota bacterium]MDP2287124.1 MaoC/PaaZ C-terminal domain-containing protein [Actinomycetota bacterium]
MTSQTEPTAEYQAYVDADAVLAYALASNDPNPLCNTGEVVSPLFTATLVVNGFRSTMSQAVPSGAITGTRASVHGMHDVHYFAPVVPGSKVICTGRHYAVRQTGAGVAITTELDVLDLDHQLLVRHYWTGMNVGATVDGEFGEAPPEHLFPDSARSKPIDSLIMEITADQGFRYGGASGDRNDHAINDEAARAEGFPSKIVQGLCTFAMCSGAVLKLVGEGDPSRLTRLAGRFSSPVFPRQQLQVDLFDAGVSADGRQLVAFEATSNGTTVVKHGRAELTI